MDVTNRQNQVNVHRLRIGYSNLKQSHIITKSTPPICIPFNVQLMIKHILDKCEHLRSTHSRFALPTSSNLSSVLNNSVLVQKTLKFLNAIIFSCFYQPNWCYYNISFLFLVMFKTFYLNN